MSYDCWAERPHALTGDACRGHRRGQRVREEKVRLWQEIARDFGKPDKTGSFFAHRVEEAVRKLVYPA